MPEPAVHHLEVGCSHDGDFIGTLVIHSAEGSVSKGSVSPEAKALALADVIDKTIEFRDPSRGTRLPFLGEWMRANLQSFALLAWCALHPKETFPGNKLSTLPGWTDVHSLTRLSNILRRSSLPVVVSAAGGFRAGEPSLVLRPDCTEHLQKWLDSATSSSRTSPPAVLGSDNDDNRLRSQCAATGLVGIYRRSDGHRIFADQMYERARHELAIMGTSAVNGFHKYRHVLQRLLDDPAQKRLFLMILNPRSPKIPLIAKATAPNIAESLAQVIHIVHRSFYGRPNFKIKFLDELPPYTGILIDGDLETPAGTPDDRSGEIRVQPLTRYMDQEKGVMLHFRPSPRVEGPFEYFARDTRQRWAHEAVERPELFSRRQHPSPSAAGLRRPRAPDPARAGHRSRKRPSRSKR